MTANSLHPSLACRNNFDRRLCYEHCLFRSNRGLSLSRASPIGMWPTVAQWNPLVALSMVIIQSLVSVIQIMLIRWHFYQMVNFLPVHFLVVQSDCGTQKQEHYTAHLITTQV